MITTSSGDLLVRSLSKTDRPLHQHTHTSGELQVLTSTNHTNRSLTVITYSLYYWLVARLIDPLGRPENYTQLKMMHLKS